MITAKISKRRFLILMTLICGIFAQVITAIPIDSRAVKVCRELELIMKRPPARRKIPTDQVKAYINIAEVDSSDLRTCAALGLAFAEDANSLDVLKKLSEDRSSGAMAAASYALKVRANAGRKPQEILNNLCFWLGRSDSTMEKMYLANRIWVDFGEAGIWTILTAAKLETPSMLTNASNLSADDMMKNILRCDLLYYLSESTDPTIIKEALALKWDETVHWTLPESLSYIMGSITPGRSRGEYENSRIALVEKMRAKLEKVK